MNVPETIRAAIDRHNLIPDGANVVVGVSGGADSIALLHAFQFLGIPCTAVHLNHGLRGTESDADEAFVRNLGFPVVVKSVDVQKLADESTLSIEMAARQARHDFFSEFDNSVIALAHHADDQAETFILKLARGAGSDGLCGMAPFQKIDGLRLIRPMLAIPRSEIIQWLEENGLSWREDATIGRAIAPGSGGEEVQDTGRYRGVAGSRYTSASASPGEDPWTHSCRTFASA